MYLRFKESLQGSSSIKNKNLPFLKINGTSFLVKMIICCILLLKQRLKQIPAMFFKNTTKKVFKSNLINILTIFFLHFSLGLLMKNFYHQDMKIEVFKPRMVTNWSMKNFHFQAFHCCLNYFYSEQLSWWNFQRKIHSLLY